MPNKPATCPLCRAPAVREFAPFCSKGCRDRDLLNWLGEGYRVPGPAAHDVHEKSQNYGVDMEGE